MRRRLVQSALCIPALSCIWESRWCQPSDDQCPPVLITTPPGRRISLLKSRIFPASARRVPARFACNSQIQSRLALSTSQHRQAGPATQDPRATTPASGLMSNSVTFSVQAQGVQRNVTKFQPNLPSGKSSGKNGIGAHIRRFPAFFLHFGLNPCLYRPHKRSTSLHHRVAH